MDKNDALIIAHQFAEAVIRKYPASRFYLFGSYAKETSHADSDIDIAVVLMDYENYLEMQLALMKIRRKIDSRIEPHPFKENDFVLSNPLVNEILRYGKEITAF